MLRPYHKMFAASVATLAISACGGGGGNTSLPGAGSPGSLVPQSQTRSALGSTVGTAYTLPSNVRSVCPDMHTFGIAHCLALLRTDVVSPNVPSGYGPSSLQAAYNLPSSKDGAGQTVAIVDAYDQPDAATDLAFYRKTFGLPACGTGCFTKVNQEGQQKNYPSGDEGWGLEISLDIEMVSAGCPKCNILLVEANSNSFSDLGASVDEAVTLGAHVVSNSYSGSGGSQAPYDHSGVVILASAGDGGYGIGEPAGYPSVVAVGGTTLNKGGSGRGWTETAWSGTGSGCAPYPQPAWQKGVDTGCSQRAANDASAVADPDTGVAVYDTYGYGGFLVVGGTSVSSPFLGSVYGLAANASKQTFAKSLWQKKNRKYLYDITSGSNGSCNPSVLCTAGKGWDGPTGWGTPDGIGAF